MDWLTFISNMWRSFVWPAVFFIGLVLFREPIKRVLLSLKFLRYGDIEAEWVDPKKKEIDIIVYHLQRSPHSFQWFRDTTELKYSNKRFSTIMATYPNILESINISGSDKKKRKRPGMRLTQEYRKNLEEMLQKSV